MSLYNPVSTQLFNALVMNDTNHDSDVDGLGTFGEAGHVLLGFFVDLTIGSVTNLNLLVRPVSPDGNDYGGQDAGKNNLGVSGLDATLDRYFAIGSASGEQLKPEGVVLPGACVLRAAATGTGGALTVWAMTYNPMS